MADTITITYDELMEYKDSLPVKKRPSKAKCHKKSEHKKKIMSSKELLADLIEQQKKDLAGNDRVYRKLRHP